MNFKQVLSHFGSAKAASEAIGVIPAAVYAWKGRGIPLGRQYQIELMTGGKLKASTVRRRVAQDVTQRESATG